MDIHELRNRLGQYFTEKHTDKLNEHPFLIANYITTDALRNVKAILMDKKVGSLDITIRNGFAEGFSDRVNLDVCLCFHGIVGSDYDSIRGCADLGLGKDEEPDSYFGQLHALSNFTIDEESMWEEIKKYESKY